MIQNNHNKYSNKHNRHHQQETHIHNTCNHTHTRTHIYITHTTHTYNTESEQFNNDGKCHDTLQKQESIQRQTKNQNFNEMQD
jgi:hypothetical protein